MYIWFYSFYLETNPSVNPDLSLALFCKEFPLSLANENPDDLVVLSTSKPAGFEVAANMLGVGMPEALAGDWPNIPLIEAESFFFSPPSLDDKLNMGVEVAEAPTAAVWDWSKREPSKEEFLANVLPTAVVAGAFRKPDAGLLDGELAEPNDAIPPSPPWASLEKMEVEFFRPPDVKDFIAAGVLDNTPPTAPGVLFSEGELPYCCGFVARVESGVLRMSPRANRDCVPGLEVDLAEYAKF